MNRHPDRMIQSDLLLNASFNRGDASDRSWANRAPTVGAGVTIASRYADFNGGSTAVISYPDDDKFDEFPLTVMCWTYIDAYTSFRSLVCKIAQTGTPYRGWHFYYGPGISRGLAFGHSEAVGTQWRQNWTASNTLAAGAWYHCAATISAVNSNSVLYINGASQSITTASGAGTITTVATNEPVRIGGKGGTDFVSFHDGLIDDARIYNRVLTATEVAQVYASGRD